MYIFSMNCLYSYPVRGSDRIRDRKPRPRPKDAGNPCEAVPETEEGRAGWKAKKLSRLAIYDNGLLASETNLGTYVDPAYGREDELEWISENMAVRPAGGRCAPFA